MRLGAWFLNVFSDEAATIPLMVGIRVVTDFALRAYMVGRRPPGVFVLRDTARPIGSGEEPAFGDLGNRHQLIYYTEAELDALLEG